MTSVGGASSGDWPAQATETVENVVVAVRDKSVRPLTLVARALVYGLVAGSVALVVLWLSSVGVLRLLNTYVFKGPQRVWASYTLLGGIFTLTGLFLWTLRRPKSKR
ncbi:MAG: hypothetical protein E6G01_06690 [Actinobacteria bacterium]|nr:MAG: hypothetical protein E6G01_06690 [Actinomycetota bacterium]